MFVYFAVLKSFFLVTIERFFDVAMFHFVSLDHASLGQSIIDQPQFFVD